MHRNLAAISACLLLALSLRSAHALIYLPENTLESLLVKSDMVAIADVSLTDEPGNRAAIEIISPLKGKLKSNRFWVSGMMLRVTTETKKPRFAVGDRIVVFLGPEKDGERAILYSQTFEGLLEAETMERCIEEIMPVAQILTDLADPKKEIAVEPLRKALTPLVSSKNAYTQILVGRLMGTRLPGAVKPESWEAVISEALATKRPELVKGAIAWSGKFEKVPAAIQLKIESIAKDFDNKSTRDAAQEFLRSKK